MVEAGIGDFVKVAITALVHEAIRTVKVISESKAAQSLPIASIKQWKYFRIVEAFTEVEDLGSSNSQ